MTIDISIVDRMNQRLEKAPSGKWYARTYDGATIVYEDEITGYTGGTIPSEINDVYAAQRTAVLLGGRQVVSETNPLTGLNEFSAGGIKSYAISDFTYATLPSASLCQGSICRVTDLAGALFESNGVRWRPVNKVALIGSLDTAANMTGTTETILFQQALPAGLIQNGDRLRIFITMGKSGTSETTTFTLRIGAAGTIADTSVQSFAAMATTTISAGMLDIFKRISATSIRKMLNGSQLSSLGSATNAVGTPVTVSNLDSVAQFLSISLTQSSTAETGTLHDVSVELVSASA